MSEVDDIDYMLYQEDFNEITDEEYRTKDNYLKFPNAKIYLETEKAYFVSFPSPKNEPQWIPKSKSYKLDDAFLISEWLLNVRSLPTL